MTRIVFVVSRNHLDIVPRLAEDTHVANVEIIVDRRERERRQRSDLLDFPDRRRLQRRRPDSRELEMIGVLVVVAS